VTSGRAPYIAGTELLIGLWHQVYIDHLRRTRQRKDAKPVIQRGKLIRGEWPSYGIISFYRLRQGVIQVDVYHQEQRKTYRLWLTRATIKVCMGVDTMWLCYSIMWL